LKGAADALRLAGQLGRSDPFTSEDGPRVLGGLLSGRTPLVSLRGFNARGAGRFVGPEMHSPQVDHEFRRGFETAREGGVYEGKPFWVPELGVVAVLALPVSDEDAEERGVVEALVSWQPIAQEFRDEAHREVKATLVDREGNVVFPLLARGAAHASLLVADFMRFPARLTRSEETPRGAVLASIAPVGQPDWGVLVERDRDLAFASVNLMVRDTVIWSAVALAGALFLGIFFARRLSDPIARLAQSVRAISEGAYGSTVTVGGTAEMAELSESFNRMSGSIRIAFDEVRRAARENRELFLSSIKALAEAIDAKDPYTRGHSERVATYAAAVAGEMGLSTEEVERTRLSALLHDGADGGRVRGHESASDQGYGDHVGDPAVEGRHSGNEVSPREVERRGLSGGAQERADPAASQDRGRGRHLRRDDDDAPVPAGHGDRLRRRPHPPARGRPIRSGRCGGFPPILRKGRPRPDPAPGAARRAGGNGAAGSTVRRARGRSLAMLAVSAALCTIAGCASQNKLQTSAEVLLNERMAAVLLREGRVREAEQAYREVLRSDARNPELHDGLGVALLTQGRTRESAEEFDRAVRLESGKALYRIHRGMARADLGRYAEAEEDFRAADASASPEDRLDVAVSRGRMRQRQGDFAAAEEQFAAALARDPKSFDALLGRGVARESRGNFAAAAEDYLEAVRLQPKSPEANLRLGLALVTLKKKALGRRYLERAVELDPGGDAGTKARLVLDSNPES
jgi:Tfp pilus assembly protein PilF/HAMP domain-containing protein